MQHERAGIVMVGSANMDIVFGVERIPAPGETLLADSMATYPGGKGLNQAVAAARAGTPTVFVGALGDDDHGRELAATMTDAGIDRSLVRSSGAPTGQAFIVVSTEAENTIIVASGANADVTALTAEEQSAIRGAAVLLMQLELPLEVVIESARLARESGTIVMLNAAPARELPTDLLDLIDYLIVNEHEACILGGSDDLAVATAALAARVDKLIVTLGSEGSELYGAGVLLATVPSRRVTAVDTTGAGDTYCGAFAAAIASDSEVAEAARFATAAAALSVQALGAVPSIPSRDRIEAMLAEAQ